MWWTAAAWAQEVQGDLHGPHVPPADGADGDPVLVALPPRGVAGHLAVGLQSELFTGTAVARSGAEESDLVGLGIGTQLGVRLSMLRRLDLAASVLYFPLLDGDATSGGAPGDATLSAPVGLVVPDAPGGLAIGLTPTVALPTGDPLRLVSDRQASGGALLSAAGAGDRLSGAASVGALLQTSVVSPYQTRGPVRVPLAAAGGARLAGPLWVHAEARGWLDPASTRVEVTGDVPAPGLGIEAFGGLGARVGPVRVAATAGRAVTGGLGAAGFRGLLSVALVHDPRPPEPEPVVVAPVGWSIALAGPDGAPVVGAEVLVGGVLAGVTGADGALVLPAEPTGPVTARAPGFVEATVVGHRATLAYLPVAVSARVSDTAGNPVSATIVAIPAGGGPAIPIGPDTVLPPGAWRIEVTAPGFGTQTRDVVVAPRAPLPPIDAVLLASAGTAGLEVTLTDPQGVPVDGAALTIDGAPVGTTSGGGRLALGGLAAGAHAIEVRHPAFAVAAVSGLPLTAGAIAELPLVLTRVPGSVRVRVTGPSGHAVDDAVVRFEGPRRLPPRALGVAGERLEVLGPGEWTVLVTSPSFGLQERTIVVPDGLVEVLPVDFVLQPEEAGSAELVVQLVDPDGGPVEGATITLDGRSYGQTSSGGTLRLTGLRPGVRSLAIAREGLRPLPPRDLLLGDGIREEVVPVAWVPGSVDVAVRGPEGAAGAAKVRFSSDAGEPEPQVPGADGHLRTTLAPGTWTVTVSSACCGLQERVLEIPKDSASLHRATFVLAPVEDGLATLALRVVDPDGTPVTGARVLLDGVERGETGDTGLLRLEELAVGNRDLAVEASPWQTEVARVRLLEGEQERELRLDWAVGAVRARVVRDGKPVPDAMVRFLGETVSDPLPVDAAGERLARLEPGFWLVVASSPTGGLAEWDLVVEPDAALTEVRLDMSGRSARSDLLVRVVDPAGVPIEDAQVWLGAPGSAERAKAGQTEQGGAVLARSLAPGPAVLTVEAADYRPSDPLALTLVPGTVETVVRLDWIPVPVELRARDASGAPVDALVSWVGPRDVAPLATGPAGSAVASLVPGAWRAFVRTTDGDPRAAVLDLVLRPGDEPRPKEVVLSGTRVVVAGGEVRLGAPVPFDFGKATLKKDAGPLLDELARALAAETGVVRFEVQGHTDAVGSVAANQALSQQRADAVRAALVVRGVAPEALVARGFGPTRPVAPNKTDEGRAKNRRVQVVILEEAAR